MNKSEFIEAINAPKEKVWDVLFNQYGEIHVHNPTMTTSNYMGNATKGELNCVRHCEFSDKLFLDEKIIEVNENNSFSIIVTKHNLPFVKEMKATYELTSIGDGKTELKMISFNSFSPAFMKYLMAGQMRKSLLKHLFGMKYYIETDNIVDKKDYAAVYKSYKQAA